MSPLCGTCRLFSKIEFGTKTKMLCVIHGVMRVEATKCNSYQDRRLPSYEEFYKMAWVLEYRKKIGFDTAQPEFMKPDKANDSRIENGPHLHTP